MFCKKSKGNQGILLVDFQSSLNGSSVNGEKILVKSFYGKVNFYTRYSGISFLLLQAVNDKCQDERNKGFFHSCCKRKSIHKCCDSEDTVQDYRLPGVNLRYEDRFSAAKLSYRKF